MYTVESLHLYVHMRNYMYMMHIRVCVCVCGDRHKQIGHANSVEATKRITGSDGGRGGVLVFIQIIISVK